MPAAPGRYRNPVLDADFPDPTIIQASDSWYYVYGTQTKLFGGRIVNIQVARSQDLVHWHYLGEALPEKPVWARGTQEFWAPHVSEHAGRYYLYYSAEPDQGPGLCLAVATADAPAGPFVDIGRPLLQTGLPGFADIDPMAFDDPATGRRWLYWGSGFGPLRVQELAPDRISFLPGSEPVEVLPAQPDDEHHYHRLIEGSWVILRHGWYYLFYSGNNCCGPDAHYGVLVARSHAATGPFETLADATGGPGAILEGNADWRGPGHNCVITDAAGQDWLAYHAIDPAQPTFNAIDADQGYSRRVMLLDRLEYTADGWPRLVTGGVASRWQPQPAPVCSTNPRSA
ncbi:glycoside hydrolase family 43 protein [Hymenobacter sp. CRA2]|uniref:glycoside hydrolase family 43 protein n=1 Tax=Hymenobacter sp. CRA2 TaxID=1955620 RepID=UPI00098FFFC7|nr:glycoside hydrolase family 43 protein [Hymenobacter sp. CRA2]OON68228.1 hypothetical protein B0919_13810 [Hymenobacter sp. CRA2]